MTDTVDFMLWTEMLKRMSLHQWRIVLAAIATVAAQDYGTVTLEIKHGVVRRVWPTPHIDLPDPAKDGE